jgi:ppGpp synthetase/RelA/SpoT-type nucleotidyltranferase
MIVPSILLTFYNGLLPALKHVYSSVQGSLSAFASPRNLPFTGRIKSVESTAEKIETGRYAKFLDIDDLVAFTVIIPNRTHEREVKQFLHSQFRVIRIRGRDTVETAPDVFRFDCTRVFCTMPATGLVDLDPRLNSIVFEVQVRTAFEHAWAVATHDQAYKVGVVDWRRLRVAAQLKAIVENLDSVVGVFDAISSATLVSPWPRLNDQIEVQRCLMALFDGDYLPTILMPQDMTRFCDNVVSLVRGARPSVGVPECLEHFRSQIIAGSLAPIPVSLSLYQLFVGSLCEAGVLSPNLRRPCHVTEEMASLFPKARALTPAFEYGPMSAQP